MADPTLLWFGFQSRQIEPRAGICGFSDRRHGYLGTWWNGRVFVLPQLDRTSFSYLAALVRVRWTRNPHGRAADYRACFNHAGAAAAEGARRRYRSARSAGLAQRI